MIIWYLLVSILYCATFLAWMKSKQPDGQNEYSNEYWSDDEFWDGKYLTLCIVGTALWPLIIPFIIFYKLAFKILNKQNKTK